MPHSPYRKTVYPPIRDLGEYERDLREHRSSYENEERDKFAEFALLEIGENLLAHCDFLDTKLGIKKRECAQQIEVWRKENEALKKENESLSTEIETLKRANQNPDNGDESRVDVNKGISTGGTTLEATQVISGDPRETVASSPKRKLEFDSTMDENTAKRMAGV